MYVGHSELEEKAPLEERELFRLKAVMICGSEVEFYYSD